MAAPTYIGFASQTGTTSISVSVATINGGAPPATGDLLLAHVARAAVATTNDAHCAAPDGWHRLGSALNNFSSHIFWRIREAGDSNSVIFTMLTGATSVAGVHCIRGVDRTRPICRHSINRTNSDTFRWLEESAPVAECLALATAACVANRSGNTPASGWTERADVSFVLHMYAQTKDLTDVGAYTDTANVVLSGSGALDCMQHMILIQPPQTATPKDVRVKTGTLTSPTVTGNQDITGFGFDCKALIIYGMRQNTDAVSADIEYGHGIGADDGVNASAQRCAGVWRVSGGTSTAGWSRNGEIVAHYFAGNSTLASPNLLATYSRIADGFRLNWAAVDASGWDFNFIALGGDDLEAICASKDGSLSPVSTLPWRPDLVHTLSQNLQSDADQLRTGSTVGQISVGWLDPAAGAQWNLCSELGATAVIRDSAFCSQAQSGSLSYDLQFSQATTHGWSWSGINTDIFFYLALNWDNATYFPVQVEIFRCETSGVAGADQVMSPFGAGQASTVKKLVHTLSGRFTTAAGASSYSFTEGHARFEYGVVDQDAVSFALSGTTAERRRKPSSGLVNAFGGDLDAPNRVGEWISATTIDWSTNTGTSNASAHLVGLLTLGYIGQTLAREISDSVDLTEALMPSSLRYLGVATAQGNSTTTTVNIATVAGGSAPAIGDLLIGHVTRTGLLQNEDQHFNAPSGWHRLGGSQNGLTSAVFWKIRESGDSNSVAFSRNTSATSNDNICSVHCIRGADRTRPICRHSIRRNSSDTFSWLAESSPVRDCLALAIGVSTTNRNGLSPASGWTERVDLAQNTTLSVYAQTKELGDAGASSGDPSTALSGSGVANLTQHMLLIQPQQEVAPKDIRVATGTLTSPTVTGNQDVTGLGFDCKALIIYGMRQNADATTPNVEYMHGAAADDGISAAAQMCVGIWHTSGFANAVCGYQSNSAVVTMYFANTTSSPELRAVFSRIADGFRLNWTIVQALGFQFNYIALGGADLKAILGSKDASTNPLTGLPWRPDMVHTVGENFQSNSSLVRANSANLGQMSMGWLDPNAGAQWNLTVDLNATYLIRDNSFYSQQSAGALTYDLQFEQATADGWSWSGSNADFFFYLALNWGNSTAFPAQVETMRADSSNVAGADQVMPSFGRSQAHATKKLVHHATARPNTSVVAASGGASEGHTKFSFAVVDQDTFAFAKATNASERRHKPDASFLVPLAGDLDAPAKIGTWQSDLSTIDWGTNDATTTLIGLFTLGFVGQKIEREISDVVSVEDLVGNQRILSDAVAVPDVAAQTTTFGRVVSDAAVVTDSLASAFTKSRTSTDAVVVADAIARTTAFGRRPTTDSAIVTEVLARTASFGRKPADSAVVTEALARTVSLGRSAIDTAAVADSLSRTATLGRKPADTVVVTDSVARTLTRSRQASDAAVVLDSLARTSLFNRTAADSVIIPDVVARTVLLGRRLADAVTVNEQLLVDRALSVSESVQTPDSFAAKVAFGRVVLEACSVVDQISVTVTIAQTDVVALAELVAVAVSAARGPALDAVVVTDRLAVTRSTALSDAVFTSESLTRAAAQVRVVQDSVAAIDSIQASVAGTLLWDSEDLIVIADDLVRATSSHRVVTDLVGTSELLSVSRSYVATISDALTAVDEPAVTRALGKELVDGITASDTLAHSQWAWRLPTDVVGATDDLSVSSSLGVKTVDSIIVDDALGRVVDGHARIVDSELTSDEILAAIIRATHVAISDLAGALDAVLLSAEYRRQTLDAIETTEQLVVTQDGIVVELSDALTTLDALSAATATAKTLSDVAAAIDTLASHRVLGAGSNDTVAIADAVIADIRTLGAESVAVTDVLVLTIWSARILHDAPDTEDSVHVGEIDFVLSGTGDFVDGPLIISAMASSQGPLFISGGPDVSPGPVGFVANLGDFVTAIDQLDVEATA